MILRMGGGNIFIAEQIPVIICHGGMPCHSAGFKYYMLIYGDQKEEEQIAKHEANRGDD